MYVYYVYILHIEKLYTCMYRSIKVIRICVCTHIYIESIYIYMYIHIYICIFGNVGMYMVFRTKLLCIGGPGPYEDQAAVLSGLRSELYIECIVNLRKVGFGS